MNNASIMDVLLQNMKLYVWLCLTLRLEVIIFLMCMKCVIYL